MTPIVFDKVTHYYGGHRALDTLSLEVPQGSIFALLGRNGAGKTTASSVGPERRARRFGSRRRKISCSST